jgi:replicative DNA helicase
LQPQTAAEYAIAYAGQLRLPVAPIPPGEKFPKGINRWQEKATNDARAVAAAWAKHPEWGVCIVTGPVAGVFVLDVDPRHGGDKSLTDLVAEHGPLPFTWMTQTGGGGAHFYFRYPQGRTITNGAATQLPAGLDVRGVGGQVVAPPTIHPSGIAYRWADEHCPLEDCPLGVAPEWLLDILDPPEPLATVSRLPSPPSDFRHDEMTPADWVRANLAWQPELVQEGWQYLETKGSREYWVRPGKNPRDGKSASLLLPDGPLYNFSPEAPVDVERGLSLFEFIAESRFGGDMAACARHVRLDLMPRPTSPVLRVEEPPKRQLVVKGDVFLYDLAIDVPARWGHGSEIFWASGESLILCGVIGSGKTTLAGQLVAGMCGLSPKLLGQPIAEARRVLVLAADRPRQIARALVRHFPEAEHRALVHDRLVIHQGPLPKLITTDDEQLMRLAQEFDCDVIVVDSLKDLGGSLSDEATGAAINRSFQLCLAQGVDVMALHHTRKESNSEGAKKENTLASVYGSNWITAGAGSVLMLYGEPGALDQKLMHLKSPIDPLGPFDVIHDNHAGTTEIAKGWDCYAWLVRRGPMGATIAEATQSEHGRPITTDSVRKKTERKLEALVNDGRARKEGKASPGVAVRYFAVPQMDIRPH